MGDQEKFMRNFQWSWVLALKFTKFSEVEFCFTWNFQGHREKPKQFQGFFSKKVCPQLPPPLFGFSFWNSPWNSQFQNSLLELVLWRHFPREKHWPYVKISQDFDKFLTFLYVFLDVPSVAIGLIDMLSFQWMKGVKVVHVLGKFYWNGICRSPVLNFQMFSY